MLFYLYSHEQNCDTQTGFYGHASSPVLWRNFVSLFFFSCMQIIVRYLLKEQNHVNLA